MNEEIGYVLEILSFKTSIYRDRSRRNLSFNDDEYYANVLNEYIEQLQQERDKYKFIVEKTIDKIEQLRFEKWSITGTDIMDLLDILDGKELEEKE